MIGRGFTTGRTAALALVGMCLASPLLPFPAAAAAIGSSQAEGYLQDAQRYLAKGEINAAIIQLKNALQQEPANVKARKLLGEIYLRAGNGTAAEREFKAALGRGSTDKQVPILLARAYLLQGKFETVLEELKNDTTDPTLRLQVLLTRAHAYLGLKQADRASELLTKAEKLAPNDSRPKTGLAQVLLSEGKLKQGEAKIDEAIAANPKDARALVIKGELLRHARDRKGAIAMYDRALEAEPGNLTARIGRAAANIDLNQTDKAQADISAVLERFPKHPLANYMSALIHFRKKDFTGAQEAIQMTGALADSYMPALFLRGAIHYALNQLEQAASDLGHYVERVPNNSGARRLLGATVLRMGDARRAIDVLTPLADSKTADANTLGLIGTAYMRLHKYAEGTKYFERAAQVAPKAAGLRTGIAVGRLAQGDAKEAVQDLEAALDLNADDHQAGILLTLVRLRSGQFDQAIDAAKKLAASMKDNPLPYNLLGAAYLGKKDIGRARESFEHALKIRPEYSPARMNLAQIAIHANKLDEAIRQYRAILDHNAKDVRAMMALADIAARQGRTDEVVAWLQKAGDANPKSVAPKLRLIRYYEQTHDGQKAVAVAHELDASVPNNPQVLEALGRAEMATDDKTSAVATFRRLVAVAPKSPKALALLAAAQASSNDASGAAASYRKALALDPNYIPAYTALAELTSKEGKTDEALGIVAKLKEKQPHAIAADVLTGDVYMRAREYDKALVAYEAASAKRDSVELALRRFDAERHAGRAEKALVALQTWVDKKDDDRARRVLATAYIAAGKYDDAIRETEKLLAKHADNPAFLNNLAWLYDRKGDARAIQFAEKAYKIVPRAPAVADTLGWILVRKGDTDRAIGLLRRAYELAPKSAEIGYHLAVALKNGGKGDEARRLLERTLDDGTAFPEVKQAQKLLKELGG